MRASMMLTSHATGQLHVPTSTRSLQSGSARMVAPVIRQVSASRGCEYCVLL